MKPTFARLFFILAILLLPSALIAAQDAPTATQEITRKDGKPAAQICKGKVNDMGGFGFRKLPCENKCPDGTTDCSWQSKTEPNGDKRYWCGCANQAEPDDCHLAVLEPNGGAPSTSCTGTKNCKVGETCKEKKKANPDGTNDITCECQ